MSFFEERGVELQMGATSVKQAEHRFCQSCTKCALTGRRGDCDSCAIKSAYDQTRWLFAEVYTYKPKHLRAEVVA